MNGTKINRREWPWPVSRHYPVPFTHRNQENCDHHDNRHSKRYLLHASAQHYFCTSLLNTTSYQVLHNQPIISYLILITFAVSTTLNISMIKELQK